MKLSVWDWKITKKELLFFISYIIFLVISILRTSLYSPIITNNIYRMMMLICLVLLVLKEYFDNTQTISLLMYLVLIFLMTLIIHKDSAFTSSMVLFYIFCSRNISFTKIAKLSYFIQLFLLLFIIASSYIGVIDNVVLDAGTERPREYLGFRYALFGPAYLANIVCLRFWIKKDEFPLFDILLFGFFDRWLYVKTNSRLSFYIVLGILICIALYKVSTRIRIPRFKNSITAKVFAVGMTFLFIFSFIFSYLIHRFYDPSVTLMYRINRIFGNRLALGQQSLKTYGVSLLGENIQWIGNGLDVDGAVTAGDYLYVDNMFLQFLQHYGILLTILCLIALTWMMYKLVRKKEYLLIFIFCTIAGRALIDNLPLHLWYNSFWLILGKTLFNQNMPSAISAYNTNHL